MLLDLVRGSTVSSLDELPRHGQDQTAWVEIKREPFVLAGKTIWLVTLEWPGEEAALVVLQESGDGRWRAEAVLGVSQGGLGASITVVDRWFDSPKRTALAVVEITRRFRSFRTDTGAWVQPGSETSWAVLGLRADAAWLARHETSDDGPVRLVDTGTGPVLMIHCFSPRAAAAPATRSEMQLPYQPRTGMFEGSCAARPQAPSTTGPTHP